MAFAEVTYTDDFGNQQKREIPTTEFYVRLEGSDGEIKELSPAVTSEIEIESDNETSTTHDQCGNMESQKTGTNGEIIRVSGIVTGSRREGNLDVLTLINEVTKGSNITVGCALFSGEINVSNRVVRQASELVKIETEETIGKEAAFEFQLQLGETQAEN